MPFLASYLTTEQLTDLRGAGLDSRLARHAVHQVSAVNLNLNDTRESGRRISCTLRGLG